MTDREVERAKFLKIADACFIKKIVVTKHVSLTDVALSKAIKDRLRYAVRAVGNRVRDVLALPRELVSVLAVLECQATAFREDLAIRRDFQRLGHRCVHLRRFTLVTIEAGFVTDELDAARVCVRPPLGEERVRLRSNE